jgi:hypothetical protein
VRERGAHEGVGGDVEGGAAEAIVAARGCHGTTRAEPRRLEDREATASASRGNRMGGVAGAPEHGGKGG